MNKPHLLILEDDPMQQKLYKVICDRFSFNCHIFNNSDEAVQFLKQDGATFDVCLMDWALGNESGLECINKVRAASSDNHHRVLPIIMVTAHAMTGDREICIRAGANDYLSKPFTLETFHSMVMRWVQESRQDPWITPQSSPFSRLQTEKELT